MRRLLVNHLISSLLICLAVFLHSSSAQVANGLRTVVLTNTPVPGVSGGASYIFFQLPSLNDQGQTAFFAFLSGTGIGSSNDGGLWSEGNGVLGLVAREGELAPGSGGSVFSRLGDASQQIPPMINNNGHTAFEANVRLPGSTGFDSLRAGAWSEGGGAGLALLALQEEAAPGTPSGVNFTRANLLSLDDQGQAAVNGSLFGNGIIQIPNDEGFNSSNDQGIWRGTSLGDLDLLIREGEPDPNMNGNIFGEFRDIVLNHTGQTAFLSGLVSGGGSGVFSNANGQFAPIAIVGEIAPGTPGGDSNRFRLFEAPAFNSRGETAFVAQVRGNGGFDSDDIGLWSEGRGNGLELVARSGEPAAGTPVGVNFNLLSISVSSRLSLNNRGQLAFLTGLEGVGINQSNNSGIWNEEGGELLLLAREGAAAPETDDGVNFSGFSDPLLNNRGQTAFLGSLAGTGVTSSNNTGIWAEDNLGELRLIVRAGDVVDLSKNPLAPDTRTFESFGLFNGDFADYASSDTRPKALNDRGQIVFRANFTDGTSGIFVSNLVAIPEPLSVVMFGLGCAGAMLTRYRDRCFTKPVVL